METMQEIKDWILKAWDWLVSSGAIYLVVILIAFYLFFIVVKKMGTRRKTEKTNNYSSDPDVAKIVNEIVEPIVNTFNQKEKKNNEAYVELRSKNQYLNEQISNIQTEIKIIHAKTASDRTKSELTKVEKMNLVSFKEIIDQLAVDYKTLRKDYSTLNQQYQQLLKNDQELNQQYQQLLKNNQGLNEKIAEIQNDVARVSSNMESQSDEAVNQEYMTAADFFREGYEAHANKKFGKAIEHYKNAIAKNPDYVEACYNLGAAYYEKGDYKQAIISYQKVIDIKPDIAKAYHNVGVAYFKLGDHSKANEYFEKAKKISR